MRATTLILTVYIYNLVAYHIVMRRGVSNKIGDNLASSLVNTPEKAWFGVFRIRYRGIIGAPLDK